MLTAILNLSLILTSCNTKTGKDSEAPTTTTSSENNTNKDPEVTPSISSDKNEPDNKLPEQEEISFPENSLEFKLLSDNTYGVKIGSDTSYKNLTVPAIYNGLPVTTVLTWGFANSDIESIVLPEGITTIEAWAFNGCLSLKSINIPNSVTSVSFDVFEDCENLLMNTYHNAKYLGNSKNKYLYLNMATNHNITSVNIHESTKIIGSSAFQDCNKLTSITIPDNVSA